MIKGIPEFVLRSHDQLTPSEQLARKEQSENLTDNEYLEEYDNPFGPTIKRIRMSDTLLDKWIKCTDEAIINKASANDTLVGEIEKEFKISHKLLEKYDLQNYVLNVVRNYVVYCLKRTQYGDGTVIDDTKVHMGAFWVNSMQEGEYNPIHMHPGCTVSSTIFLKIPEYDLRKSTGMKSRIGTGHTDGRLEMIHNCANSLTLETGTFRINPLPGDMYIWPSTLLHTVYPFLGTGERRSIAFNATHLLPTETLYDQPHIASYNKRYDKGTQVVGEAL